MRALIGQRHSMRLSTTTLRSILDSIATRLDESRDTSRYLIGLLVFLGLLGTFWGLLGTIGSINTVIQSLDVGTGSTRDVLGALKTGLSAPLVGMGTAFSTSLFGLSGSLILGFLDLQAGRAQNRFYTELENWLSSVTDVSSDLMAPVPARRQRRRLPRSCVRLTEQLRVAQAGWRHEPAHDRRRWRALPRAFRAWSRTCATSSRCCATGSKRSRKRRSRCARRSTSFGAHRPYGQDSGIRTNAEARRIEDAGGSDRWRLHARAAHKRTVDYWPGFVDALSTLLMAIMFLLSVFVLGAIPAQPRNQRQG